MKEAVEEPVFVVSGCRACVLCMGRDRARVFCLGRKGKERLLFWAPAFSSARLAVSCMKSAAKAIPGQSTQVGHEDGQGRCAYDPKGDVIPHILPTKVFKSPG